MGPAIVMTCVAIFVVFGVAALIILFTHPTNKVGFLVQDAAAAFEAREFNRAEEYYQKIVDILPRLPDPEQRAAAEFVAEQGLGLCALKFDDFPTAERHLTRAVQLLDQGVELDRAVIAHLMTDLAVSYHAQAKTTQAEQTLQRLREICEGAAEWETHRVAELVIDAANGAAYRNFKDLAFEITKIAGASLNATEEWYDSSQAHLQITLASFHMLYCERDTARLLIESALESAAEELDYNDAATAYSNLGWIHVLSGEPAAAIESFERTLEIREAEDGPDHWNTGIALSSLADAYRIMGDYRRAREYSDEAWEIQNAQLPSDDAIRAGTAITRSALLIDLGEFDIAEQLLTDAVQVADAGEQPAQSAAVRLIQGLNALNQLHFDRADCLLQEARAIAEDVYGTGHRMTCDYLAMQGANLIRFGHYEEAEVILTEALAIRDALTDGSVIDLADLLVILADLYQETDRAADAEATIARAQELVDGRVAETHLIHAEIQRVLGCIRHAQSNEEAAVNHFRRALQVRDQVQPADHPRRVPLLDAYARSLESIGETALADKQRAQAEQIRAKYRDGK